jgi:hypothetical protein
VFSLLGGAKLLRFRSFIAPLVALVTVAGALATLAVVATGTAAGAKPTAHAWRVGDCYAEANVDFDEVTLTSKVPCTESHEVQILEGAALPANLAKAGIATLTDGTSNEHAELRDFAGQTCRPADLVGSVYPKAARKLAAQMRTSDVRGWVPPAPGNMGWVLPEAASFDAGNKDLLCIFHVARDAVNTTPGDVRKLATRAALGGFRICFDFNADNAGTGAASCANVHDVESLIWVELPAAGHPDKVADWTDEDYSTFDTTCGRLGEALVGASRPDLKLRAFTGETPISERGTRLFDCTAYPTVDTQRLPAGSIVGVGKAKIAFVDTKS